MRSIPLRKQSWLWAAGAVAVAFGLLTIRAGGAVLFGAEAAREAAGNYVPFVVWFNFLAGFVYVIAGVGLFARARWAAHLALAIAAATLIVFIAFGVHVATGGSYELRTVIAMKLRGALWLAIAAVAYRLLAPESVRATA
jgi:hypothetical protein